MADNRVFISYRRDPGYPWARLIWENLGDKGVDAFLDLESMRAAGRFDDRLLNQIASRPYFIAILTARTLDRCAGPDDWMRREIEHAIDTNRIIVPTFIAPFEPSGFPADLPSHIDKALSQSQGLTVYSQYLSAATDKLADELLAPVEMESIGLTEEDARFQSRAIRQVRALPPPPLPPTPIAEPDGTDADADADAIGTAAPAAAGGVISAGTPDAPTEQAEPPDTTPTDTHDAPTEPPDTTP
ncbi:toll/interleukin-1 receptor domain-containing protein, partial [Ilumatobacter sp.]|uniref:toll/interleukin-1 receptor domain-containing protein n=1 Tax=Ilumatobacter sp. TaxID=1967498 RepID=UPI003AF8DB2C